MRRPVLLISLLCLPLLVFAADDKKEGLKTEPEPPAPPKPAVRTVQAKAGHFQFNLRLDPGVPDPGHVESVRLEMAEIPPVPDPIYGESIPVKGADLVAEVTDADGAGYTLAYRIHPLSDAGAYGFHFTPTRRDTYRVVLRGKHKNQKFSPSFRVPVGIWPFKDVDDKGRERVVPARPASSRMPALPGGAKTPAIPAGPGRSGPANSGAAKGSPIHEAMVHMGELWVDLQVALFAGRRPDLSKAKRAAEGLQQAATDSAGVLPGDRDFEPLMKEMAGVISELVKATGGGKGAPAVNVFNKVGGRHCNRCHFAKRWKVIATPAEFPAGLP